MNGEFKTFEVEIIEIITAVKDSSVLRISESINKSRSLCYFYTVNGVFDYLDRNGRSSVAAVKRRVSSVTSALFPRSEHLVF